MSMPKPSMYNFIGVKYKAVHQNQQRHKNHRFGALVPPDQLHFQSNQFTGFAKAVQESNIAGLRQFCFA